MIEVKRKIEGNPVSIFYKDKKIGECETLLAFEYTRLQIAKEYSLKTSKNDATSTSDYSFEYNGIRIFFLKDGTYDARGYDFWEDINLNYLSEIIRIKCSMRA